MGPLPLCSVDDKKEFSQDMKGVYAAPTRQAAISAPKALEQNGRTNTPMLLNAGRKTGMN